MPRNTRYLSLEKNIAASDTGGILERWRYGRHLLTDPQRTTKAGNLKHGVLAELIGIAAKAGTSITEREIQYRIQCARAYLTEAEIRTACSDFAVWSDLRTAGFPQVQVADPGEPYDPRTGSEKWKQFRDEEARRQRENPEQGALFELPTFFSHDTYGPRTPLRTLIAGCDESERMTANYVKRDAERRAYVTELETAADGNLDMTWYEAEARRLGLGVLGLDTWEEFGEIIADFFGRSDQEE